MNSVPSAVLDSEFLRSEALAQPRHVAPEIRIALFFACLWACGRLLGLPLNWPDEASLTFVQHHYFSPLLLALALQFPLFLWASRRNRGDALLLLKLAPFLALVLLIHFNFKAWMPLVNPCLCDQTYRQIDQTAWPMVALFRQLRQGIADVAPVSLDHAYHGLFVAMFFISFGVHAVWDTPRHQRQLVVGLSLVLLIGGLCYWIAPALGPFLFEPGLNEASGQAQRHMLGMFAEVAQHGTLPEGYFTAPLAAMPSLHVAHALFFTLFAFRTARWLFWMYLPLLTWIVIESVASGWHYLIDLPIGAVLAVYCLHLTIRLLPDRRWSDWHLAPPPEIEERPATCGIS